MCEYHNTLSNMKCQFKCSLRPASFVQLPENREVQQIALHNREKGDVINF